MTPKKQEVSKPKTDVQPQPQPTPAATPAAKPEQKKEVAPSKQQLAIIALVAGLKQERNIALTERQIVKDGKFVLVAVDEGWPQIQIGPGGGYNLPEIKSYPKADLQTMLHADQLLKKQMERVAKLTATAPAPKPAVKPEEKKAETPTQKKHAADEKLEKQLSA